ncbi:F-box domain protein [Pandoravirus inopinatum]|uniref:F-box domain protein n=1 Tax=Pandoravirus inopinatum TaxID=1605721 RepID=A0A0B5J1Y8_9VIRU|nr:F-box domain protein [Pandoravirus inopinatum]AJF97564.1 F-box domain protein [Pandoravirus inopinatum]
MDVSEPEHMHDIKKRDRPVANLPRDGERDRKRTKTFDVESLIPNEILAMILAFVRPADIPTAARVARRWRDLAPPPEPDVVLAYKDGWSMDLSIVPRPKIKQRNLDRLRLEAAGTFVGHDDGDDNLDPDDICHVCLDLGEAESITLWQLFRNLRDRNCKVEMFAVWINERRDVIDDYWVTRFDDERELAAELVDWAREELADTDDDDTDAISFKMPDLGSDEGLREMSVLVEEACKIVH